MEVMLAAAKPPAMPRNGPDHDGDAESATCPARAGADIINAENNAAAMNERDFNTVDSPPRELDVPS